MVEALPTTELNYESLAGVLKYIIKKLSNSIRFLLAFCLYFVVFLGEVSVVHF